MKVIFLDIDGVLNNEATKFGRKFDAKCVSYLNWITELTGAAIVVSSTWRHAGLVETRAALSANGVRGRVYSLTPDLSRKQIVHVAVARGLEIQAWLDAHPSVKSFVILDDAADMEHLLPHLVQTASRAGLSNIDAELAVKHLTTGVH